MVSFDLSFRSMSIEDIYEDEGTLWNEGSISCLSTNIGPYEVNRVHVVYGAFCHCAVISLGVAFRASGFLSF